MRGRLSIVVAGAAACTLVLSACGGDSGSGGGSGGEGSQEPYRVLVGAAQSAQGTLATNANAGVLAVEASAEVLNRDGGIDGREIVVTVVGDGGDPTQAVSNLREAVNSDEKPDLYVNTGLSTLSAATLPILKQNGILSFNMGPTADSFDPSVYPLNFDLSPSAADYAEGFVPYLEEQGYETVGIIHGNSAYGTTFGREAEKAFQDAGFEIVANEEYDVTALDMTPQLTSIQSKNPDVLVVDGYGAPVGYLLQSKQRLGWDVPIVTNNSVAATGLISSEPPNGVLGTDQVENVMMQVFDSVVHQPEEDQRPAVTEMIEAMSSLGEIQTTLIQAYNYDALRLVAAAAESIGSSDDPEALAEALEDPEVQEAADTAVLKRYNYSEDSHAPNVDDDAFVFVAPSKILNGQFGNPQA
jgi:branched-chain amino acid transport system substrate-binding protein